MQEYKTIFDRFADDLASIAGLVVHEIIILTSPEPGMSIVDFLELQESMKHRYANIRLIPVCTLT
jgi:hypothetical protein